MTNKENIQRAFKVMLEGINPIKRGLVVFGVGAKWTIARIYPPYVLGASLLMFALIHMHFVSSGGTTVLTLNFKDLFIQYSIVIGFYFLGLLVMTIRHPLTFAIGTIYILWYGALIVRSILNGQTEAIGILSAAYLFYGVFMGLPAAYWYFETEKVLARYKQSKLEVETLKKEVRAISE